MFNPSEIMRNAWADYRRDAFNGWGVRRGAPFNRQHFAYCLRMAWAVAKDRAAKASQPVAAPQPRKVLVPSAAARADAIRAEMRDMDFGDFIPWDRRRVLSAELNKLGA